MKAGATAHIRPGNLPLVTRLRIPRSRHISFPPQNPSKRSISVKKNPKSSNSPQKPNHTLPPRYAHTSPHPPPPYVPHHPLHPHLPNNLPTPLPPLRLQNPHNPHQHLHFPLLFRIPLRAPNHQSARSRGRDRQPQHLPLRARDRECIR